MIRRLLNQLQGGASAGRRPTRGGRGRRGRSTGGTGARIGSAVERYMRTRRR